MDITLRAGEATWPIGLATLPQPPTQLHCRGELGDLQCAVAIVGTRHADPGALEFTQKLAAAVAGAGGVVISGGARGIDAAAHAGAIAGGGRTIVVLASGLANAYPPRNAPLFAQVVDAGGTLLSEYDAEEPAAGWRCLQRNRLIAALAKVVVIVQAPLRSGALSTAAWAQRLQRPLLVVPSAPWDIRGGGCLGLLRRGAQVCSGEKEVLAAIGLVGSSERRRHAAASAPAHLAPELRRLLLQLGTQPQHADELAESLRVPAAQVQAALLQLMLQGLVQTAGGGLYARLQQLRAATTDR